MTQRNDGGPAYPIPDPFHLEPKNVEETKRLASGMSLRDYFAAKAMQGFIAAGYLDGVQNYGQAEAQLARDSLSAADAFLAARERT